MLDAYDLSLVSGLGVSLEDLRGLSDRSFKSLYDLSCHNDLKVKSALRYFLDKIETVPESVHTYDVNSDYGEYSRNYRFRVFFLIIRDDVICVPCKVLDPMGSHERYFSVIPPISMLGSKENEMEVLRVFSEFPCIRSVRLVTDNPDSKDIWECNFYNTRESCEYMFKSKFKCKKGINRLTPIVPIEIRSDCDDKTFDEIFELYDLWEGVRGFKVNRTSDKNMLRGMSSNPDLLLFLSYYNERLLSYAICLALNERYVSVYFAKYASILSEEALANYCRCSIKEAEPIKSYLGSYMQYCMHDYFLRIKDYEALYYTGTSGRRSLENYKKLYFKKCLYYTKVPFQDYVHQVGK